MRHKVYGKHLGRNKNERTALFKNLVQSLFIEGSIKTTQAKAKAVKGLVDKVINQAKSPDTRRLVSQFLVKKETQERLIKDILPQVKSRNSGYTSVVRLGRRLGDGTMIVKMSLLTDQPLKPIEKKVTSNQSRMRLASGGKKPTSAKVSAGKQVTRFARRARKEPDESKESKVAKKGCQEIVCPQTFYQQKI